tara:strand:- start:1231 stop:2049 length:819 start_codon:yes stop_codon:yes gene_type:complete
MSLVSTEWLEKNLDKVRVIDATWHMPNSGRDAYSEYSKAHIANAVFFDLDKNSDEKSSLPHMLPNKEKWKKLVSEFGIKNSDHLVVYDNSDVVSSCRCWYSFIYFGHDPKNVSVLDGGFLKWINEKKPTENKKVEFKKTNYNVIENKSLTKNKKQIEENIFSKKFDLIDARSRERFEGIKPEPRQGLKSGHIKNSKNIPFTECLNKIDRTFKNKDELSKIFNKEDINNKKNTVFTCGSGVTACVLGLANSIISGKTPIVYDGSWSEYGKINK